MSIHVLPVNDLKPHEELSTCDCEPSLIIENGEMIFIHNSYDKRELNEALSLASMNARAIIAGDLLRNSEITRRECFRIEMDASLGEFSGHINFEENTDFIDEVM